MFRTTRRYRGGRVNPPKEKPNRHCQCETSCTLPAVRGQPFCRKHMYRCHVKSPMTGWEPDYKPDEYNGDKAIQYSHNCFAYALNVKDAKHIRACRKTRQCDVPFHIPGRTAGHPRFSGNMGKFCSDVISRTIADIPGKSSKFSSFQTKCPPRTSKIAVVVDEENDLHYYRQDSNGWWSHKPGGREVTNKDASGIRIWRPDLADRYYQKEDPMDSELNYSKFCSYLCVPRDRPIVISAGGGRRGTRRRGLRKVRKGTRKHNA